MKIMIMKLGLIPGLLALAGGCAAPPETYRAATDLAYVPGGGVRQRGDVYLPRDAAEKPFPVAVVVHGGGWTGRDRSDMERICAVLASEGVASFNINYRLAPAHTYPAPVEDVRSALGHLTTLAETYPLDLNEVYLVGYSAGAHLALLTAIRPGEGRPAIRGVLAGGAPTVLSRYPDSPRVRDLMGGPPDDPPERYREASPLLNITSAHPRTFLYHGRWDRIVGLQNSKLYRDRLEEEGVPVRLDVRNLTGHILTFFWSGPSIREGIRYLRNGGDG